MLMTLLWIGLVALIVWAVVRLVQDRGGRGPARHHGETPLEILDRRFARGDIDAEAYERTRQTLLEHSQPPR
ncbi:SHOCT domain-containing protein [Dactylosporangium sucinum]|nr:SHOCT domain-containing protein [Dactylosporangium sucinum]